MENVEENTPEDIFLTELIQTRVTAGEKIKALRMAQALDLPMSIIIRALLSQAVKAHTAGSLGGFALEQNGMNAVFKALTPRPKQ